MRSDEIKAIFDQQAAGYDEQWARMAPVRDGLHFLLDAVFADLPPDARILSVGVGTGAELAHLARVFPTWRFMAVDPSGPMLDRCREKADAAGFLWRCEFHEGYVDALPVEAGFDGATCFLVSQFILEQEARCSFFQEIARRLRPGAILASSDLASDIDAASYEALLRVWLMTMSSAGVQPDVLERTRTAYARDVGVLPPARIASIIQSAGFEPPVQFFQAGLIHAWFARRAPQPRP